MKPLDKFGNEIYPTIFKKMQAYAHILHAHGYTESKTKPNLFYKKDDSHSGVIYFADMRGTDIVPIWQDTQPLFYLNTPDDFPQWLINRLHNDELTTLRICRRSFHDYTPDSGEDGYCIVCGKDFQGYGLYCSPQCREADKDLGKERCQVCGNLLPWNKIIDHHLNYQENKTIHVCRSCHAKIHLAGKLPHLKPSPKNALQDPRCRAKVLNLFTKYGHPNG